MTNLNQINVFSRFLSDGKYKHDVLIRRIHELIRLTEAEDIRLSREIASQIRETAAWQSGGTQSNLFLASYLLTLLMLYEMQEDKPEPTREVDHKELPACDADIPQTEQRQAIGQERTGLNNKDEILEAGKSIYLSPRNRYTGPNNRKYADGPAYTAAKYILAEERFITNHDDTAMFVELIDEDEQVMISWKFDCPMKKCFSDPDYYEDDCLVFYMTEDFHLPTVGYRWPK